MVSVPMQVLWGSSGVAADAGTPLDTWRTRATEVSGGPIDAGHLLCEENAAATTAAMLPFLAATGLDR